MPRLIPGLAKLPEKRKITQTKKQQRYCIYDRSKRNRGISRNGRSTHCLLTMTKIMQCFALRLRVVGVGKTIVTRANNAFATDEAGLVKSLAD